MTTLNGTTSLAEIRTAYREAREQLEALSDLASDLLEENEMLVEQNDDLSSELAALQQEVHDLRQPGNVLLRQ